MSIQKVTLNPLSFRGVNNSAKQSFKTQKETGEESNKLTLALDALAVSGAAGAIEYSEKTDPESIINKMKKEASDVLKDADNTAKEIDMANKEAFDLYGKAEDVMGGIIYSSQRQDIINGATVEEAEFDFDKIEVLARKLNDGTGRIIIASPKDDISVMADDTGRIRTIKNGQDKIYLNTRGEISQFAKGYTSEDEVKKADKLFDFGESSYNITENAQAPKTANHVFSPKKSSKNWLFNKDKNLVSYSDGATDTGFIYDAYGNLELGKVGKYLARFENDGRVSSFEKDGTKYILKNGSWVEPE